MKKATRPISLLLCALLACSAIFTGCGRNTSRLYADSDPNEFFTVVSRNGGQNGGQNSSYDTRTPGAAYINDQVGLRFDLPGSDWALYPEEELTELWDSSLSAYDSTLAATANQITSVDLEAVSTSGSSVTLVVVDAAMLERMDLTCNRASYFDQFADGFVSSLAENELLTIRQTGKYEWEMAGLKWIRQDIRCDTYGYTVMDAAVLACDTGNTILSLVVMRTSDEALTMEQILGSFSSSRSAAAGYAPSSSFSFAPAETDVTGRYVIKEFNGQSVEYFFMTEMGAEAVEYLRELNVSSFEELITFEFKANGTVIFTEAGEGTETGTWTQQGSRVIITISGTSREAALSGGELTLVTDDGSVFVFRKK